MWSVVFEMVELRVLNPSLRPGDELNEMTASDDGRSEGWRAGSCGNRLMVNNNKKRPKKANYSRDWRKERPVDFAGTDR